MVQESGGPGEKHIFQAVKGEFEVKAGDRGTEKKTANEMMKCEYCDKLDHLESSCPTKKADRRTEVGVGCFFMFAMAPFYVLGLLAGMVKSAFKAGFGFTDDFWPETWKAVRGKKNDDVEQISD